MTTIGRRVDDKMRRRRKDDETMGTAQPAGWIRRRRCNGSRRIGVGVKGSQGGGREGELRVYCVSNSWWSWGHGVFFGDTTCLLARLMERSQNSFYDFFTLIN